MNWMTLNVKCECWLSHPVLSVLSEHMIPIVIKNTGKHK